MGVGAVELGDRDVGVTQGLVLAQDFDDGGVDGAADAVGLVLLRRGRYNESSTRVKIPTMPLL